MALISVLLLLTVPEPPSASVVLRWKPVEGAVRYEVEISDDPNFRTLALTLRIEGTGYRWSELPDKPHYFRVRSIDSEGRLGPYSEVKEIAAVWAPPPLSKPRAGSYPLERGMTLTFDFIPSLLFSSYRLEVATDAGFSNVYVDRTFELPPVHVPIKGTGVIYYRLRALSSNGRSAGPSEPAQITIVPETPDLRVDDGLLIPPGESIELRWSQSAGAVTYRVQVASEPRFRTLLGEYKTADRRYAWTPTQSGELYWRVVAEDGAGRRSPPALARKVTVLAAPQSAFTRSVLADLDAGALIGVYGGVNHDLRALLSGQSGLLFGARIGAGVGDVLLVLSLGFGALNPSAQLRMQAQSFLLATVPFVQYDFHLADFRLRAGVGPAMNALFVSLPAQRINGFALGIASVLGLGWSFGRQEIGVEVRYTYAPLSLRSGTSTLSFDAGGLLVALAVWYGGS